MSIIKTIFKRELASYFVTPVAYIFIVVFLFLAGIMTFYFGDFFPRGQADLNSFFTFHPWLYLFLVPALAMRAWAEERNNGTIEVLFTLPVTPMQAVLGKFFAVWVFTGVALLLTMSLWITVNVLGEPDNGVILAGYLGSFLMVGAFLAISSAMSALTRSQVVAFVLSLVVCLLFVLSGFPLVLDFFSGWVPEPVLQAISSMSFLTHFNAISKGVIDFRDLIYFISVMVFFLFATVVIINLKKAD